MDFQQINLTDLYKIKMRVGISVLKKKNLTFILFFLISIIIVIAILSGYKIKHLNSELRVAENKLVLNKKLNTLTVNSFEKRTENKKKVTFVYIGNGECSDCSIFSPLLVRALSKKKLLECVFYVDMEYIHKNQKKWLLFKKRYDFSQTPCLMIYKNGKRISKLEWDTKNGISKNRLEEWLNKNYSIIRTFAI